MSRPSVTEEWGVGEDRGLWTRLKSPRSQEAFTALIRALPPNHRRGCRPNPRRPRPDLLCPITSTRASRSRELRESRDACPIRQIPRHFDLVPEHLVVQVEAEIGGEALHPWSGHDGVGQSPRRSGSRA